MLIALAKDFDSQFAMMELLLKVSPDVVSDYTHHPAPDSSANIFLPFRPC
jgi:hypothetical protein